MIEFTASNGLIVTEHPNGPDGLVIERLGMAGLHRLNCFEVAGLREFFQKENDDRFDRWRWPANPEYVVYAWTADPARTARGVTVLSESIPRGYTVWEDTIDTLYGPSENEEARALARKAARAWFDAHPEPKPWDDAKPGEVWVVKFRTGPTFDERALVVPESGWDRNLLVVDARRVWPEVAS